MKVEGESISIELEGAQVTLDPRAIAELWIEKVRGGAREAVVSLPSLRIGERGKTVIYAGIARGVDGERDHVLIVLDDDPGELKWADAVEWAAKLGATLPTRRELALCYANVPELFEKAWYWSCEQSAGDEASAWAQGFANGGQTTTRKHHELRARAVRRLPL